MRNTIASEIIIRLVSDENAPPSAAPTAPRPTPTPRCAGVRTPSVAADFRTVFFGEALARLRPAFRPVRRA